MQYVDTCPLNADTGGMDLTEPATVVMAPSTAALLRVLAGADDLFTGRQLARLAGVSHAHAAKVIDRLAEHGLVLVEERGTSKLVRLNRDHLAAEAVIQFAQLRTRLRDLVSAEIDAWALFPMSASLFGSAARGDGGTGSDLDILVVRRDDVAADDPQWEGQLFETAVRIRAATGNNVSWFETTLDDLRRAVQTGEPLIAEWKRDAVAVHGPSLRTVLRRVS